MAGTPGRLEGVHQFHAVALPRPFPDSRIQDGLMLMAGERIGEAGIARPV